MEPGPAHAQTRQNRTRHTVPRHPTSHDTTERLLLVLRLTDAESRPDARYETARNTTPLVSTCPDSALPNQTTRLSWYQSRRHWCQDYPQQHSAALVEARLDRITQTKTPSSCFLPRGTRKTSLCARPDKTRRSITFLHSSTQHESTFSCSPSHECGEQDYLTFRYVSIQFRPYRYYAEQNDFLFLGISLADVDARTFSGLVPTIPDSAALNNTTSCSSPRRRRRTRPC